MNQMEKNQDNGGVVRDLIILKRRVPLKVEYIRDKIGEYGAMKGQVNGYKYFYRNFETHFQIKAGDVFMVKHLRFEGIGSELSGDHLYAAILDSDPINPLIRVVPLKSYYEQTREENPASDVRIGKIAGTNDNRESLAVINQTKTIDKMRLFSGMVVKSLDEFVINGCDYKPIKVQEKYVYRLSRQQLEIIRKAVQEYDFNGYIHH